MVTQIKSEQRKIKDKTHSYSTLPDNGFQKIIVVCTLICFAIIWAATIYQALTECFTNLTGVDEHTGQTVTASLGMGWRIALLLVLELVLLWFFRVIFRHFESCSMRRLHVDAAVLFFCSLVIYLVLISQLRIVPITDSHSVLDQALSLARNGLDSMSADSIYANYFSKYANNYPVTLLFAGYFWLVEKLGVSDMYLASCLFNMCCLLLGSLFTWLAAKRAFGPRTAAKVLLLCVMNPVYYLMVFWVYTNTLSVPFVMALIYLALCVRDARSRRMRTLLAAVLGAVAAAGIQLRATTAIPVIAIVICFGIEVFQRIQNAERNPNFRERDVQEEKSRDYRKTKEGSKDRKYKEIRNDFVRQKRAEYGKIRKGCPGWTGVLLAAVAVTAAVYLTISTACSSCFSEVSDGNYPITHWLMMGSHGNGTYNTTDDRYTFSFETQEEKKEATLAAAIENYKELGATGTAQLFLRKMVITWSDGYFGADQRLGQTMRYTPLYSLLVGEESDFFQLYCQVFWLAVGFFVICACIRCLRGKSMRLLPFLLILTLFGAIIFYWFWEVKAAYALPFLPIFYLLAGYGSGLWQKEEVIQVARSEKMISGAAGTEHFNETGCEKEMVKRSLQKKPSGNHREWLASLVLILLFAVAVCQKISSYETIHYDYSIYSNGGSWMKSIDLDEGDTVTQEFYPNAAFNRIALRVKAQSEEGQEEDATNDCRLQVTLTDAAGAIVYQGFITAEDIKDQMAVLSVGEHPADAQGGYVLTVTKEKGTSGNLLLRTRKGLCLDDYRGTFTICGEEQETDLYLQVYREYF